MFFRGVETTNQICIWTLKQISKNRRVNLGKADFSLWTCHGHKTCTYMHIRFSHILYSYFQAHLGWRLPLTVLFFFPGGLKPPTTYVYIYIYILMQLMYWRLLECLIWEFISLSDLWNTEAFPLPPRRGRPQVHFQDVQDFVVREFEQRLDKSLLTKVGCKIWPNWGWWWNVVKFPTGMVIPIG